MNDLEIRSQWSRIRDEEDKINKIMCDYLWFKNENDILRYASRLFDKEVENLIDPQDKRSWGEARAEAQKIMNKSMDDFLKEAEDDFNADLKPNSPKFRSLLYQALEDTEFDTFTKKDIQALVTQTLHKVRTNWSKYNSISQGLLATNLTVQIEDLLKISYDGELDFNTAREHIKDALYQYRGKLQQGMPPDVQDKLTSEGLVNELEDAIWSNSANRQEVAEFIWNSLYNDYKNVIGEPTTTEKSSGENLNYDFKTIAKGWLNDTERRNTALEKQVKLFFDSKASVSGIGSRTNNFLISSEEVIDVINSESDSHEALLKYNRKPSYDNQLLLEYLISQYKDRPLYYLIDKANKEVYSLSYLVDEDMLKMDTGGLHLLTHEITKGKYMIQYAKATKK